MAATYPRENSIKVVAGIIVNASGQTLLVRKQGSSAFMQPGGKPAPGEDAIATLKREIYEELGCELAPDSIRHAGRFISPAANEPDHWVEADLFFASLTSPPVAQSEIAKIAWVSADNPAHLTLAPLTRDHVLPFLLFKAPYPSCRNEKRPK